MAKKENTMDELFLVNLGIEKGVDKLIKSHPRFREREKEIIAHIEKPKLKEKIWSTYQEVAHKHLSGPKRQEYIVETLSDYIASGKALDEEGKEIILLKGLEEKAKSGFIRGLHARKMLKGEAYLDRSLALAHNLSYIMESGNYAEKMPEIAKAARTLEDMQLLDPLIKVMKYNGSINKREYKFLQNRVYEKARESEKRIMKGIEKYLQPKKVAASILMILGSMILFSNSRITGGVIGGSNIINGITGIILIAVALFIFLFSKKKNNSQHLKK